MAIAGAPGSTSPTVKSAMRTLDIIEYVVANPDGVVAQEIAQALAIPVSSLSYLLATLVERDYLARTGRHYQPGAGLERLRSSPRKLPLVERVRPLVRTLRVRSNETASFFLQRDWFLEAAITETAEHTLRYSIGVGTRTPLHCLAAGKALLAALDPETLEHYFRESSRERYTAATITEEAALRREIDEARELGFAVTREEMTPGICGVDTVLREDGQPVGSLAIAIPTVRWTPEIEEATSKVLISVAESFSR